MTVFCCFLTHVMQKHQFLVPQEKIPNFNPKTAFSVYRIAKNEQKQEVLSTKSRTELVLQSVLGQRCVTCAKLRQVQKKNAKEAKHQKREGTKRGEPPKESDFKSIGFLRSAFFVWRIGACKREEEGKNLLFSTHFVWSL